MKLFYLSIMVCISTVSHISVADPIDKIAELIRQRNIHEMAKSFAGNVEVTILGDENVYSKAQAEVIIDKFFSQNLPRAVKMLHRVNSNPKYRFGVLIVNTSNGTYRVAVTLKETEGNLALIEFRVETEGVHGK